MVTYLIGVDTEEASEAIAGFFEGEKLDADDHVEAVSVTKRSAIADYQTGKRALELLADRLEGTASIETRVVYRGRSPAEDLPILAEEVDADRIVVGLRRHSRTERIISGSVSNALVRRVTRPLVLVPLPEYQPPEA
jgi:nucleotide-binding universal stress UspA family protein